MREGENRDRSRKRASDEPWRDTVSGRDCHLSMFTVRHTLMVATHTHTEERQVSSQQHAQGRGRVQVAAPGEQPDGWGEFILATPSLQLHQALDTAGRQDNWTVNKACFLRRPCSCVLKVSVLEDTWHTHTHLLLCHLSPASTQTKADRRHTCSPVNTPPPHPHPPPHTTQTHMQDFKRHRRSTAQKPSQ